MSTINIDLESITNEASGKVWEEMYGGAAAPLSEQDPMLQHSVKSKVLPVINIVVPVVEKAVENSIKTRLIAEINAAHEAGHDPEFTIMALLAQLEDND